MNISMNPAFKHLYDLVVERSGKSNRPQEIINLISEVTQEEHVARFYLKDLSTALWDSSDTSDLNEGYENRGALHSPIHCQNDFNILDFELPSDAIRGFKKITISSLGFEDSFNEHELRHNGFEYARADPNYMGDDVQAMYMGQTVKIKSGTSLKLVLVEYYGIPNTGAGDYDSWIGIGPWENVIVDEVSARILDSIGAHNAGTLFQTAERARTHMRVDNKHSVGGT